MGGASVRVSSMLTGIESRGFCTNTGAFDAPSGYFTSAASFIFFPFLFLQAHKYTTQHKNTQTKTGTVDDTTVTVRTSDGFLGGGSGDTIDTLDETVLDQLGETEEVQSAEKLEDPDCESGTGEGGTDDGVWGVEVGDAAGDVSGENDTKGEADTVTLLANELETELDVNDGEIALDALPVVVPTRVTLGVGDTFETEMLFDGVEEDKVALDVEDATLRDQVSEDERVGVGEGVHRVLL